MALVNLMPAEVMMAPIQTVRDPNFDTCFPTELLLETIEELRSRGTRFVTFADMSDELLQQPTQTREDFSTEYRRWVAMSGALAGSVLAPRWLLRLRSRLARLKNGWSIGQLFGLSSDLQPPWVVLRHDADRQAYKTSSVMQCEQGHGVVSSSYFFAERHIWDEDHEPYELDLQTLKSLEDSGFEIGYHVNAYERAAYDPRRADQLVSKDVEKLGQHFKIRTYTPHGGVRGPNGINNHNIPKVGELRRLTWAGTGGGFWFDAYWSDGYLEHSVVEDPRKFARRVKRGMRVTMLFHPQYLGDKLAPKWLERPIGQQAWWRSCWEKRGWPMLESVDKAV